MAWLFILIHFLCEIFLRPPGHIPVEASFFSFQSAHFHQGNNLMSIQFLYNSITKKVSISSLLHSYHTHTSLISCPVSKASSKSNNSQFLSGNIYFGSSWLCLSWLWARLPSPQPMEKMGLSDKTSTYYGWAHLHIRSACLEKSKNLKHQRRHKAIQGVGRVRPG